MAFCSNCGAKVEDDAVFCHRCGAKLQHAIADDGDMSSISTKMSKEGMTSRAAKPLKHDGSLKVDAAALGKTIGGVFGNFTNSVNENPPKANTPSVEGFANSFAANLGSVAADARNTLEAAFVERRTVIPRQSEMQAAHSLVSGEQIQNCNHNLDERSQEYAGYVLKCPNCGTSITQSTVICPECGHKITGQAAISSVQEFSRELMAIESHRNNGVFGLFNDGSEARADEKLTLVKSFPIPNTIDDICEFIFLAIANIDVTLSKKSYWNNTRGSETDLSNAWVSKMQQAYQKAKMLFPSDSTFIYIQQIYFEKMKELKLMK